MGQEQDFSMRQLLGEEGERKDGAEKSGVFYEENRGRRGED